MLFWGFGTFSVREVATVTPFAVDGAHSLGFSWRGEPFRLPKTRIQNGKIVTLNVLEERKFRIFHKVFNVTIFPSRSGFLAIYFGMCVFLGFGRFVL